MARTSSSRIGRAQGNAAVKIGAADIEFARRHAPAALEYYSKLGLAEVRRRSLRLILTGLIPVIGLLALEWSALSMLLFLLADLLITLVADWLRWSLARPWINASHSRDMDASTVLLIVDGLDDGTGMRPNTGRGQASGGLLLFLGTACSLFALPILAVAVERLGLPALSRVVEDPYWLPLVIANAVVTVGGGVLRSLAIRRTPVGEQLLVLESGSIMLWYLGMLVSVWLPIHFGMTGLLWMFIILHGIRLLFGAFAWYWMPRAVYRIALRQTRDDFSVRTPAVAA